MGLRVPKSARTACNEDARTPDFTTTHFDQFTTHPVNVQPRTSLKFKFRQIYNSDKIKMSKTPYVYFYET